MTALDARALRDAFGAFATGVTVVTTRAPDGEPRGFTANSFASVSLDPPLLLVCLAKTSRSLDAYQAARGFAVNVLAESQREVSQAFASSRGERFASVQWRDGPAGNPVFDDVAAWFDCSRHALVDGGDHVILVGRVEAFDTSTRNGLGYVRGGYFSPALERRAEGIAEGAPVVVGVIVERDGAVLLVPDTDGRLDLPHTATAGSSQGRLRGLLAGLGLSATPGFIYAVYEHTASGAQHIVYRCSAGAGTPRDGAFHPLDSLPFDRLAEPATAAALRRFVAEHRIGSFGIYAGDQHAGVVQPLAGDHR